MISTARGPVLTVTINRPDRRNAINEAVAAGLHDALDAAEADPAIRVVVLTGAGDKAFCAGGDMQKDAEGPPFELQASDPRHYIVRLFTRMNACRLPLIARVNGHALGGGLGLVCGCDLAVARDDALLGTSEVKVGLFPMMILPLLLRMLPVRQFMEMCLTGEPFTGAEAAAAGIVNYAVPADGLDDKVDWLVGRVADKSPTGIRLGKQALATIREMGFAQSLEYAQFMLATMATTEDAREGFSAFAGRRKPNWTGA